MWPHTSDEEVPNIHVLLLNTEYCRVVRATRGHNVAGRTWTSNLERALRWKMEAAKLNKLIKRKERRGTWRRAGRMTQWKVVGFAKGPWRLKATKGEVPESGEEKAAYLAGEEFQVGQRDEQMGEVEAPVAQHWDRGMLKEQIREALRGPLGDALLNQIAEELVWERCRRNGRLRRVVVIPKPGKKTHCEAQAWRPIKLAEEVVRDRLKGTEVGKKREELGPQTHQV